MYQDKASRKRRAGRSPRATGQPDAAGGSTLDDGDIQRTASGLMN